MVEEMATFASDLSCQTLVTDLVNELSTELEIPFLLNSSSDYENEAKYDDLLLDKENYDMKDDDLLLDKEKCDLKDDDDLLLGKENYDLKDDDDLLLDKEKYDLKYDDDDLLLDKEKYDLKYDNVFYEKEENDLWLDREILAGSNCVENKMECITDVDNVQSHSFQNDELKSLFKTDSSGHGSGSDSSSTELGTTKDERNGSPVTPTEERISPDNVIFFPNNEPELNFIPNAEGIKQQTLSNGSKTVRIQPKPNTALDNIDNQIRYDQTVMCNVFKDGRPTITTTEDAASEKVEAIKSGFMARKDSELLQAKRKQERMIRNRESAFLSRKRKKEYVAHLEKQVQDLLSENNQLRQENHELREKLLKYENEEEDNRDRKKRNIFPDSSKKTTALLALMFIVCLNVGSFSNFLSIKSVGPITGNYDESDGKLPFYMQNVRYSRSLLWSGQNIEELNSLSNLSKTSCPINQTESIRLESELRRWIKGDEDFSRPFKRNTNKVGGYAYTSDRVTKNQNKLKKKIRSRKMQSSDVEVDVFGMKPHFFNFDTLFEAIHRRDDTFYLVSFSADHLLLPALSHNKTSRPKMSLMLPAFLSNSTLGVSSDQVEMIQIDCEVTNTQLLSVNENDIPLYMRPYSNSTSKEKGSNTEDKTNFSQFLVQLNGKKSFAESNNGSFKRGIRNISSLKKANDRRVQDLGDKLKSSKPNEFKFSRFHDGVHIDQIMKGKNIKLKSKNIGDGLFFSGGGSKSKNVNNRSNNVVSDGMQFADPNGRSFLKTLIDPPTKPTKEPTKSIGNDKKPYVKSYKNTKRFLFP